MFFTMVRVTADCRAARVFHPVRAQLIMSRSRNRESNTKCPEPNTEFEQDHYIHESDNNIIHVGICISSCPYFSASLVSILLF